MWRRARTFQVLERPKNTTGDWVLTAFEKSLPISVRQFSILVGDLKLVNETSIPRECPCLRQHYMSACPGNKDLSMQQVLCR